MYNRIQNNFITKLLFFGLVAVTVVSFSACGEEEEVITEKPKVKEGEITYEVTYPYYSDGFMASLMPDEMIMTFKDGVYKNVVTKGGIFTTTVIADCHEKELIMLLDFGLKKMYSVLDAALVDTMLLTYPIPDILNADKIDTLAGYGCNKHMAVFDELADGYDMEIFETSDIDIPNSNWCNQFSEVEGVLLGYELTQYGLTMRMEALEVSGKKVANDAFDIPEGFKEVPLERMLYELEEIFKALVE